MSSQRCKQNRFEGSIRLTHGYCFQASNQLLFELRQNLTYYNTENKVKKLSFVFVASSRKRNLKRKHYEASYPDAS